MQQDETETFIYRSPQRRLDPEPLRHARHGGRRHDDDGCWTQNSGSITIHKYEYNGNDAKESTGENTDEKKCSY